MDEVQRLDETDAKNGDLPKFARSVFTDITLQNSGSWTNIKHGRVWRAQITAQGAKGLIPYYDKFYLPQGAALHVYTPDKQILIGAFTTANNTADGYFCSGLIHGESFILEYFEPAEVTGKGVISINEICYAYRMIPPAKRTGSDFGEAAPCEVNVNCAEGNDFKNQKRAVARILVKGSFGTGWCTGTLLNNTRQNCTPYMLTAQHCMEGVTTNQLSQWVFYFNYEAPGCTDPASEGTLGTHIMTGCTKKADSNDNGGDTGSDFLLLQLYLSPLPLYNVYYAGWDAQGAPSPSGRCIHHPSGDIKKISTYVSPTQTTTWNFIPNTHWKVTWSATTNGHGVTEEGSSGAPLFNPQGMLIGTLTGGSSSCENPDLRDLFGKFSYGWLSNGTSVDRRLKPWLDPDNTGTLIMQGIDASCVVSGITAPSASDEVKVWPNPSANNFSIYFNTASEKNLCIYDAIGNLIITTKTAAQKFIVDLSGYSTGVYILHIEANGKNNFKKLVLQ